MKKYILILLFSFIISNDEKLLVLKPQADLKGGYLKYDDIETINVLFVDAFRTHSNQSIIENVDNYSCYSMECGIELAINLGADEVVISKIRVLGSKIIFTGIIFDNIGKNDFNSKITVDSVEDMDKAAVRLAISLIEREAIEETAHVDNIVENESEERTRRKAIYKYGLSIGYMMPFGDSYQYLDFETDESVEPSSILQMALVNYWEFQNNRAALLDLYANLGNPFGVGADLSYIQFANYFDNTLFYGGGIGWHWNLLYTGETDEYEEHILESSHGVALSAHGGFMLFRTYDFNILLRTKYHIMLQEEMNHGLTFSVSVIRKRDSRKGNNGYGGRNFDIFDLLRILFGS